MPVSLNFLTLTCKSDSVSIKSSDLIICRYCITTKHGPFEWSIYKRYRNFHELHKALVQFVEAETHRSISVVERYLLKTKRGDFSN